jgi:DNA invertase Pin-like site-specific DNA recombinase
MDGSLRCRRDPRLDSYKSKGSFAACGAAGRMVAGYSPGLAERELELGRERRTAAREARRGRGQSIRPPEGVGRVKNGPTAEDACER